MTAAIVADLYDRHVRRLPTEQQIELLSKAPDGELESAPLPAEKDDVGLPGPGGLSEA